MKSHSSLGADSDYGRSDIRRLFVTLVCVELALAALYGLTVILGVPKGIFDLDGENNIPAWFSTVQLAAIAFVFALLGRREARATFSAGATSSTLSIVFLFLSLDEAASIHERLADVLGRAALVPSFHPRPGRTAGAWILPYLEGAALLILLGRRQLAEYYSSSPQGAKLMAGGFGLLLLAAAGGEALSFELLLRQHRPAWYAVEVLAEEFMEMLGASLILCGALTLHHERRGIPLVRNHKPAAAGNKL